MYRVISEIVLLVGFSFFVLFGMVSGRESFEGIGFIGLALLLSLLVVEMFFSSRGGRRKSLEDKARSFITRRLGFDYQNKALLDEHNMSSKDVENIRSWFFAHQKELSVSRRFWSKEALVRVPPIGMDWASGYTPMLDRYAREVKPESLTLDEHFFFHGYFSYIEQVERILASVGSHNVLLVGEEGVGKRYVLMGLERLIESGRARSSLAYKRFVWVDSQVLLSGIKDGGELRSRLLHVFSEASQAGNIVLGIERFHSLLSPEFPEIADVLIPFLQSKNLQLVATTSPQFVSRTFASRNDLTSLFAQVSIKEPSEDETIVILQEIVSKIEQRDAVFVGYSALKDIISHSLYFSERARPERDIALLYEVVSFVSSKGKKEIEKEDVLAFLSSRTGIPLGALKDDERQKLLALEDLMHKEVINQKHAVSVVANALRRSRMAVRDSKRPIGSFLFLGPTGVGKTTVAKVLAKTLFGKEESMIRFDMSEFQQIENIARLIGEEHGEGFRGGLLTDAVRRQPFCVLLFDEVEKAHPDILNLFLQILDEGQITDASGVRVNFDNTLIIATSNAGSEFIRSNISQVGLPEFSANLLDVIQKEGIFRPELLNRFDAVVAFSPLGRTELFAIAELMLHSLAQRLASEHNISLTITDELKAFLVDRGFNEEYGARPMRRVMQDTIESYIAKQLLEKKLVRGGSVRVPVSEL